MSLAHLRFYGGPVPSQRTVSLKNSKVSFEQIVLVAMSSAVSMWNNPLPEMEGTMRFFIAFADILDLAQQHRTQRLNWSRVLADQAHRVLSSDQAERQEMARLVGLGWRRYGAFLAPDKDHPAPFFGLINPDGCIRLLNLPDGAIVTMRNMADYIPFGLEGAITRYVYPDFEGFRMIEHGSHTPQSLSDTTTKSYCRWTTMPASWWNEEDCISMILDHAIYVMKTLGELCGLLEPGELFREIYGDPFTPRFITGGAKKRLRFWKDLETRCVWNRQRLDSIQRLKSDHDRNLNLIELLYRKKGMSCSLAILTAEYTFMDPQTRAWIGHKSNCRLISSQKRSILRLQNFLTTRVTATGPH